MRIVFNNEMRDLDNKAIQEIGIPSLVLMENAGLEAAHIISQWAIDHQYDGEILLFCGKGKNGGDGLVVARHLLARGLKIRVFLCNDPSQFKSESATNLAILQQQKAKITVIDSMTTLEAYFSSASPPFLVVDAILGTGLDRPLEGIYADTIEMLNRHATDIIALDIASGIMGDSGKVAGTSVHASATISFGYPKVGHFLPPGAARRGKLYNIDLTFPRKWHQEGDKLLLQSHNIAPRLKERDRYAHKNSFGHCLLVGGSEGRLGAIVMASQSCLKMGTGLVTVGGFEDVVPLLEAKLPSEVMTYKITKKNERVVAPSDAYLKGFSSVVVGPGLGVRPEGAEVLRYLLEHYSGPLLIDADGLNVIAEFKLHETLARRHAPCALTPHPGEMARLLKINKSQVMDDPVGSLKQAVEMTNAVVILKGATTLISSPEGKVYFNHYPNDGLAKAGSGDVLAGMIGGLLGQGLSALDATLIGVYTHSYAGRLAAQNYGERTMTATDITKNIFQAFNSLTDSEKRQKNNAVTELF